MSRSLPSDGSAAGRPVEHAVAHPVARRRLITAIALAAASALLLAGCTADSLADSQRDGSDKGYISGDGAVETFLTSERRDPVTFGGTTDQGTDFDSTDALGGVVVVNFWYASCPPCRVEAPDLESLSQEFSADGVQFIGVNVRDEAGQAQAFAEKFGVTYPSILDSATSDVQLAFSASIQPNAVPTTLVLDADGRVAARILGQVTEPTTLETIIRETVAETS
ncbi:TlpA family protein disulfide reductase [Naasia lichenicola]|uniref:TlpA family protein disulfide reductase n=1 Tax=Naasia lichenicola TaxID=2565933 RepID=UPI001E3538A2|nr:TlpA disulfide reductase family protein [Naasia lichenicola]